MVFFGSKKAEPTELNPQQKYMEEFKNKTAQEIAQADVSELVENLTKECFNICFTNPGAAVSSAESKCVKQCAQKFMTAWDLTSGVYLNRLKDAQSTGK